MRITCGLVPALVGRGLRMNRCLSIAVRMVLGLLLSAGTAQAADLYSSGSKTWDTTTANWGVSGGPYNTATWNNATPDNAFFEVSNSSPSLFCLWRNKGVYGAGVVSEIMFKSL